MNINHIQVKFLQITSFISFYRFIFKHIENDFLMVLHHSHCHVSIRERKLLQFFSIAPYKENGHINRQRLRIKTTDKTDIRTLVVNL